ncbi:MAG: hypothetical protein AAB511_03365 [Patescibacteria group bacterium]
MSLLYYLGVQLPSEVLVAVLEEVVLSVEIVAVVVVSKGVVLVASEFAAGVDGVDGVVSVSVCAVCTDSAGVGAG